MCAADPNEKVINRAKKLSNGNEVGKAKEFLLTSFDNETNGTVLDVPNKSIKYPPWDLLSKRNIEHLQRLIMKPNLLPKHLHDFQKRLRLHAMWQKEKTCVRLFVRKMRIKRARQRYQNEMGKTFLVPEYCRGSPVEQFLKVLFVVCGAVCWAAILPGFVLHLYTCSRHGVCKYSYYSGVRDRSSGRRPRVPRVAGAFTFASAMKVNFCSFEFSHVWEMMTIKKNRAVFWTKRGSGSAGSSCRRLLNKKPAADGRARRSKRRGRGHRSAARRARASSFLLVLVSLAFFCASVGHAYDVLPNGDGSSSSTGSGLRKVVSDWISGEPAKSTVVAKYGPIEDWNVASVTSLESVFDDMETFNADLSKWNTAKVTNMYGSTSTPLLCASVRCFFLRILFSHPSSFLRSSSS